MRCGVLVWLLIGLFLIFAMPCASAELEPLQTIHGPLPMERCSLTYREPHPKWWQKIPHPTIQQLSNFNTIAGTGMTIFQAYWMIHNWRLHN